MALFDDDDSDVLAVQAIAEIKKVKKVLQEIFTDVSEQKLQIDKLSASMRETELKIARIDGGIDAIMEKANISVNVKQDVASGKK